MSEIKRPLTQELKERWVAALRSGEYKQGKSRLCRRKRYCCLGVLAEIQGELKKGNVYYSQGPDDCGHSGFLADEFERDFHYLSRDTQMYLATKNDKGESFEDLADYIEEEIECEG